MNNCKLKPAIILILIVMFIGSITTIGQAETVGVTIKRDSYGTPHIYSESLEGLYYGFGYAVAQDRLFQLEMLRRIPYGKVAEVAGPDYYEFDVMMRRDYPSKQQLKEMFKNLPSTYRNILNSYADGINAWIDEVMADKENKLPIEFTQFGFEPEKWDGIDATTPYLAIFGLFMDLSNEMYNAEFYAFLQGKYGDKAQKFFDDMVWGNDPSALTSIPKADLAHQGSVPAGEQVSLLNLQGLSESAKVFKAESNISATMLASLGMELPNRMQNGSIRSFSYSLSVGASKSKTGEPILMGGPQFDFWTPSMLHEVGLHGFGMNVVGSTLVGTPFIMFGHNDVAAFTSTAGAGNIQDIFEEQLNPENPLQYKHNGKWVDMEEHKQKIYVKGEKEARVTDIYKTVHGIVVAMVDTDKDGKNDVAYTKKLACYDNYLDGIMGFYKFMTADRPELVKEAGALNSLSINFIYADVNGNIAYYHCGHYPERAKGYDRRLPVPGTGEYDWVGKLDPMNNPSVINPSTGYIVNWNNKPSVNWGNDDLGGIFNWAGWGPDHRSLRIMQLAEAGKMGVTDVEEVIHDIADFDLRTMHFKSYLVEALASVPDDLTLGEIKTFIENWNNYRRDSNGDGYYDSVGLTIWNKWWQIVNKDIFSDEIGDYYKVLVDNYAGYSFFYRVMLGDKASLPVRNDYFNGANWKTVFVDSMRAAVDELANQYGTTDMTKWKTKAKTMNFSPANLWGVPTSTQDPITVAYMDRGSQNHIVLLKKTGPVGENVVAPGTNAFINQAGVRGANFADQMPLFETWKYKPMYFKKTDVTINMKTTKVLTFNFVEKKID